MANSNIIKMEDDDEDDEELSDHENTNNSGFFAGSFFTNQPPLGSPVESSKPFEVLRDLLCHHAHLAVFMNYVISNSDPAAVVRCKD